MLGVRWASLLGVGVTEVVAIVTTVVAKESVDMATLFEQISTALVCFTSTIIINKQISNFLF